MSPPSLFESLAANPEVRARLAGLEGGAEVLAHFEGIARRDMVAATRPVTRLGATPAALYAATRLTFLLADTGAEGSERAELLARSDGVTVEGARRLRLTDAARALVLDAAAGGAALGDVLAATAPEDQALIAGAGAGTRDGDALASSWLRAFLRKALPPADASAPATLRAALAASEALALCDPRVASAPPPARLKRALDLADLVQPLMILIGMREGGGADRFVGREAELARLRGFVDVLGSERLFEAATRFVKRQVRRAARATGLGVARGMTVTARGGLGKSALMAKFVIDHFLRAADPLPFVYLDFDRASIQPRNPEQLAIEAARQIAFEFPDFADAFGEVRADLRQRLAARDSGAATDPATPAATLDPFTALRGVIDGVVAKTGAETVLVVLDTVEVAQSDPQAMDGVRAFLARLIGDGFAALRLVAAGRAPIPELADLPGLVMDADPLALDALSPRDARAMVDRLGRDLVGPDWPAAWTRKLAGGAADPAARREPLTLRVAVEFIRDADPDARDALATEIAVLGEAADADFVGRLYERRVLDHLRDPDVRRVAWPGLVARRLTRDVLARVLAPICGLAPERVDAAFDRLAREVWIVEHDGDALRHRADLRARTLPLMRRRDPGRFDAVVAALASYYRATGDRVEAAYYRLLGGEDPRFLLGEAAPDTVDALARATGDFAPDGLAWSCLRSRFGPLMARAAFARLPPEFAFTHLARAGAALRGLGDLRVEPMVLAPLDRPATPRLLDATACVARQSLLIKTGRWDAIDPDDLRIPDQPLDAAMLAYFGARAGIGGVIARDRALAAGAALRGAEVARSGPLAWLVLAHLLPLAWLDGAAALAEVDARLAVLLARGIAPGRETRIALRVALVWAARSAPGLAAHWARLDPSGPAEDRGVSGDEVRALLALEEVAAPRRGDGRDELAARLALLGGRALRADRGSGGAAWFGDEPLLPMFAASLAAGRYGDPPAGAVLRRVQAVFAARAEDWVSPLGYAIAPLGDGRDALAVMRAAVAAGDVARVLDAAGATDAPDIARARLAMLREAFVRWRAAHAGGARDGQMA